MQFQLLLLGAFFITTSSFTVLPSSNKPGSAQICPTAYSSVLFSDSSPSDTSSDDYVYQDVVTIESENHVPTVGESLANNVMDLLPTTVGEVSRETRSTINEAIYKLEAKNPTKRPALSPLLNGVWALRYVGGYSPDWAVPSPSRQLALFVYSGGYTPGIFALQLAQSLPSQIVETGDLEICISRVQPRVDASIQVKLFGGRESSVSVKTRLEAESDMRLRETYESATVLDRSIDIPQPLQYARDLYVTYLDDDLLIVRDATGVPDVLVRKDKIFSQNWGVEPSSLDDMMPPGEVY